MNDKKSQFIVMNDIVNDILNDKKGPNILIKIITAGRAFV